METSRNRVMAHLAHLITNMGFVPTMHAEFGNGGVMGIQNDDLPVNLGQVYYNFNDDNMSFEISVNDGTNMIKVPSQQGSTNHVDFVMDYGALAEFKRFSGVLSEQLKQLHEKFGKKVLR
jgi:hypothetical protein